MLDSCIINYCHYPNLFASNADFQAELSWDEFVARNYECVMLENKMDGALWAPHRVATAENGAPLSRERRNVLDLSMLVIDIDHCENAIQQCERVLRSYRGLWHTTYSNGLDEERCRLVLPLARRVQQRDWKPFYLAALRHLKLSASANVADESVSDPSRVFYVFCAAPDNLNLADVSHSDGPILDPNDVAYELPLYASGRSDDNSTPRGATISEMTPLQIGEKLSRRNLTRSYFDYDVNGPDNDFDRYLEMLGGTKYGPTKDGIAWTRPGQPQFSAISAVVRSEQHDPRGLRSLIVHSASWHGLTQNAPYTLSQLRATTLHPDLDRTEALRLSARELRELGWGQ